MQNLIKTEKTITAISKKAAKRGKPFAPGQSGNPTGRPKKTSQEFALIDACRSKGPEALKVLEDIMYTGSESNKLKAAMAILERGYGRPEQPAPATSSGLTVVVMSEADMLL